VKENDEQLYGGERDRGDKTTGAGEGGDGRGVGGVAYRANMVRCRTTQSPVRGHDAFLECGCHGKFATRPIACSCGKVVAHRARRRGRPNSGAVGDCILGMNDD